MRRMSILIGVCTVMAMVLTLYAQTQRDIDPIMKEVGPTFQAMGKNIAAGNMAADVARDAEKLQGLFREAGAFMKAQKQEKAVAWASEAAAAAAEVGKAAKANDMAAAKTHRDNLQKQCKTCHEVHREMLPDKTSKFKAP